MRTSARSRRPCRISSWPAACGMRCVNPSSATVSPSRTSWATASLSGTSTGLERERVRAARDRHPAQLGELVDHRLPAEAPPAGVLHAAERHLRLACHRTARPVDDPRLELLREEEAAVGVARE